MSYELSFHPDALAAWEKLDGSVREVFKKNLPNGCIPRALQHQRKVGHLKLVTDID